MTTRTLILIGIVVILLASSGLFYASLPGAIPLTPYGLDGSSGEDQVMAVPPEESLTPARPAPAASAKAGRVVVLLTDAGVSLDDLESVRMTVDEISVASGKGGWIALVSSPREVDLVALYRTSSLATMADVNLDEGTYDRVRMKISKVTVVEKGSGGVMHTAKLPSGTLTFIANLTVQKGKSSSILVDVLAAQALHKTGNGLYIFFPVMKVAMQSDVTVRTLGGGSYVTGGKSSFDATLGMDETGTMKSGFTFLPGTEFEYIGNTIHVRRLGEAETGTVTASAAVDAALKSGYIDTAVSVQMSMRGGKPVWRVFGLKGFLPATVYIDITTGAVAGKE
ncbi:hypothetical protein A2880_00010 [Candidatus Peribacteria bacterium RIFCSPHIGHO2_01_FULL_49_38]|nr:MAG: hypothetical protein A2880_00010 [Candidatus Peribacteria bacterium RIFCSPHIGHO2_01_FULL_49_38]